MERIQLVTSNTYGSVRDRNTQDENINVTLQVNLTPRTCTLLQRKLATTLWNTAQSIEKAVSGEVEDVTVEVVLYVCERVETPVIFAFSSQSKTATKLKVVDYDITFSKPLPCLMKNLMQFIKNTQTALDKKFMGKGYNFRNTNKLVPAVPMTPATEIEIPLEPEI